MGSKKVVKFFRKYFCEGQKLTESVVTKLPDNLPPLQRFLVRYRKLIGLGIPAVFCQLLWWSLAVRYNLFQLFPDRFFMSLLMIFGGLVAGMTCEGGGAIAFPVMTLAFKISPDVARDFSMLVQSCGMSAASFAIFWMQIQLEWHSIVCCSLGSWIGIILGLEFLTDRISSDVKKMFFVSVWAAFACALFMLNRRRKRTTYDTIQQANVWKFLTLFVLGFIGGITTSLTGSGTDICSFSILTLLFLVSEKVATPTSVILMANSSLVGVYWRQFMMGGISREAWEYIAVAAPVVFICAPIGSLLASHFHRQTLAWMIYILEAVALVGGYAVVKPGLYLSIGSVSLLLGSVLGFWILGWLGQRIAKDLEASKEEVLNGTLLENI